VIDAVEWALDTDGPTLIDIAVDPDEPTPYDAAEYETDIDPTAY
jgi:thiamine pyrophosphate-dependent acetolactate synthase large subunit-like protein